MNISEEFKSLFERDLLRLKQELLQYQNEEDLWAKHPGISNSGGNLAMHLCGNLQHFIGAVLDGSSYQRNRDFEFNGRISKEEIIGGIDKTISALNAFFEISDDEVYQNEYPLEVFGYKMSTFYFVSHLYGHLNYHLGQVNYHRRILSK